MKFLQRIICKVTSKGGANTNSPTWEHTGKSLSISQRLALRDGQDSVRNLPKASCGFFSKSETTINALTGNAHMLTSCKTECTLSYPAWAREFRSLKHKLLRVSTENPSVLNNKAFVLSSSTDVRGLNPKINIPCRVCKAESKTQVFMVHNHLASYSLLTLCREGNGCVSKAEFSSS